MLIFQLHLPHVSIQALHALSHSEITFWKAPSHFQHVSLMLLQRKTKLRRMKVEFSKCTSR